MQNMSVTADRGSSANNTLHGIRATTWSYYRKFGPVRPEEGSSKVSGSDMAGSGETRGYTSAISVLLRGLPDERGIVQFLNLKTQ